MVGIFVSQSCRHAWNARKSCERLLDVVALRLQECDQADARTKACTCARTLLTHTAG